MWHSDVTWREKPSLGSILRGRIMPEVGGDTMFADMVAAYEGLSPAMKEWVCTLTAVHDGSIFATLQGKPKESFWEQFPPQRPSRWCAPIPKPANARSMSTRPSPPTSRG